MTSEETLPFTINYGHNSHTSIALALYEFITNAMDANEGIFPEVNIQDRKIVIKDHGNGLDKRHITILGSFSGVSNPNRHGSHGIGLKDAIACCVRHNCVLEIKSKRNCFSFIKEDTAMIKLLTREDLDTPGTAVSIQFHTNINVQSVMKELKKQFLNLSKPPLELQTKDIRVYKRTNDFPNGAVFIKGVRKLNHPPLDFIYNFVNLSTDQKKSISRDHCFQPKKFKKFFKNKILQANPKERFQQPSAATESVTTTQATQATLSSSLQPSSMKAEAPPTPKLATEQSLKPVAADPPLNALLADITSNCMTPDYHVWSLSNDERARVEVINGSMHNLLRNLEGLSVSATQGQGSWEKNTFVPLVSDIDIIVDINEYPKNESNPDQINQRKIISQRLKDALKEKGVRLEDSGDRIINCTYKGYQFDLVLDPKNAPRDRFQMIRRAPHKDSATMKSFIRAMKYFKGRSGIDMKSCIIEEVVLKLWDQISGKTGKEAFKIFLENVIPSLNDEIKDLYELDQASIDEMETLAKQTLPKLQTL